LHRIRRREITPSNLYLNQETDLSAYNKGYLSDKWCGYKLSLIKEELVQSILEVRSDGEIISEIENHEEVFITGDESEIVIEEYDDIYRLNERQRLCKSTQIITR